MSSRPIALRFDLETPDLIPDLRGILVVLLRNRLPEIPLELFQLSLALQRTRQPGRLFSHLRRSFVHPLQQRLQSVGKRVVAIAATEPPGFLEISLAETANRTLLHAAATFNFLGCPQTQKQIGKREASRIGHPLLL